MQNNTDDNAFSYNKLPSQGYSNTLHDVAAVDPYQMAQQMRVMPRQLSTGAQRGEQTIFGKLIIHSSDGDTDRDITLDGDSGQITVTTGTDVVGLGAIPGNSTETGLFGGNINSTDGSIELVWKIVGATRYIYDLLNNGVNVMQDGKLPDGGYGWDVAQTGKNVSEIYES